ncbi:MAG: DUF2752 domain-containing protein [Acidobacteria bacterium]|nr:DUF2752 domain-containing protein [Acidobacteriota bacterium]
MRREPLLRALVVGSLLLACAGLRLPDQPAFRLCGFYQLTHLDCPLCGLTRGLCAAIQGEWRQAIQLHVLSPLALAWLAGLFVVSLAAAVGRDWSLPAGIRSRLLIATGVLFLGVWPLRLTGVLAAYFRRV